MDIERHIAKEFYRSFLVLTTLLTALMISTELSETLTKVLTGQYSDNAVWVIVGLQMPILLAELIPGAYLLSLLTVLYRQMQDHERAIYHTMGKSDFDLLKTLLITTALPITLIVIFLTNIGGPSAHRMTTEYINSQLNRPITDLIQPKTFIEIPNTTSTLYSSGASESDSVLLGIVAIEKNDNVFSVTRSQSLQTKRDESGQFFSFINGQSTDFAFVEDQPTTIRTFDSMSIKIPDSSEREPRLRLSSKTTQEVLEEGNNNRQSLLVFLHRVFLGLFIPVFCTLAVALTRFRPRAPKVGALLIGISFYVLSNFTYRTIRSAFANTDLTLWLSPWWLFAGTILITILLMKRRT